MALNAIEWMATIFSVIVLVKFLFLSFNPKGWKSFANWIFDNLGVTKVIYLIIALVTGYYFLQYYNVVVLMAAYFFAAMMMGYTLMTDKKFLKDYSDKIFKAGNFISRYWVAWIIYVGLSVWTLWTIFG